MPIDNYRSVIRDTTKFSGGKAYGTAGGYVAIDRYIWADAEYYYANSEDGSR